MKQSDTNTLIREILASVQSIAVIGFSDDPQRESNEVAQFLQTRGYRVFGVNPKLAGRVVDGIAVYASIADIPGSVDMVDIFRREDFLEDEIHRAVKQGAQKASA